MKSKTKAEPTLRERAAALAVMASEVLLMVLDDPSKAAAAAVRTAPKATPKAPKISKAAKPAGKRKGRPPMTEAQRAAAKAEREAKASAAAPKSFTAFMAEVANEHAVTGVAPVRPKPQPVTRESLAARSAVGQAEPPSYFTKVS